jgi:predicted DNA-binding protein
LSIVKGESARNSQGKKENKETHTMRTSKQVIKEIEGRIEEYEDLLIAHDNNQDAVHELNVAISELSHLAEWIRK